jgi:SAM-dependent methyltransferase
VSTGVSVVITAHDGVPYLPEAIASVAAQTHRVHEVIVVGEGTSALPRAAPSGASVRVVSAPGPSAGAGRNAGLREARSGHVLFLDADDALTPVAIAAGLSHFDRHPSAALVYGAHRRVDAGGNPIGPRRYRGITGDPYAAVLEGDLIGPSAAALYRRKALEEVGGFDESLSCFADYDAHLRIARQYPVASHPTETVLCRRPGGRTTAELRSMLRAVLRVHAAHRPRPTEAAEWQRAWRSGRRNLHRQYALEALDQAGGSLRSSPRAVLAAGRMSPRLIGRLAVDRAVRVIVAALPATLGEPVARRRPDLRAPGLGRVRLGDLARTQPVSLDFGFDRGSPVDRYYIEQFLDTERADIRGRVLEVGDPTYSQRFGDDRIQQQDVVHVHADNPHATIVGDISRPGTLSPAAFDCIVLTQTLHLIYDMRAAVTELHRALAPGGVLLLTVPGISQIDRGEWGDQWFWALTPAAVHRLLGDAFGPESVTVESHGNVFAATAFLQGLSLAEIDKTKLDPRDEAYPLIVTARAQKWADVGRSSI